MINPDHHHHAIREPEQVVAQAMSKLGAQRPSLPLWTKLKLRAPAFADPWAALAVVSLRVRVRHTIRTMWRCAPARQRR